MKLNYKGMHGKKAFTAHLHHIPLYHISSVISCIFFLPNNPKNLDPSYKMDLDLWDCKER